MLAYYEIDMGRPFGHFHVEYAVSLEIFETYHRVTAAPHAGRELRVERADRLVHLLHTRAHRGARR